jgi:hypothetical protein
MVLSRRASWFLLAVGVWTWLIWPRFLKAIWDDPRSWHDGATSFFIVHAVLVSASLVIGTAVGWLGVRGIKASRRAGRGTSGAPTRTAEGAEGRVSVRTGTDAT